MKLRTQIILVTGLTLMVTSILFGIASFGAKEQALLSGMDDKLLATARLAKEILPADYHDKITGADSVSDAEYLLIVNRWNRLCEQLGLEYIWSVMLINGKTVFTSGSSMSKNVKQGDHARFFETHSNPEVYEVALLTLTQQSQIIDDKWGRIKVVLLPFKDAHGRPFLFGASMKMTNVDMLTKRTVWQSLLISLAILVLGLTLNILLAGSLVRPLEKFIKLTKSISEGNWGRVGETSGASEIRSLGHTINEMSLAIQEKIEQLKRAGDLVSREQEFTHALLDNIADGVVGCDSKGRLVFFNQTARDWHGMDACALPPEEWGRHYNLYGSDGITPLPPDAIPLIRALRGEHVRASEMTIVQQGHAPRHIQANGSPFVDSQNNLLGAVVVMRDITEHKRTAEELQKMQKLQSVGTLAGGIAHDFNNILLGLFGNISLAKAELSEEHPGYALLEESEKSMNRAVRLTKQLLTFAKGGEPIKDAVSLGTLVDEVARFDLSGSNVNLDYRLAKNLWQAEVDKGQIQQVVSNLVINARQAMPSGGCLHIGLENAALKAEAVPGLCQGNYVKVTVRDEGVGIEAKYLGRIFDPYFTTKQAGNGLGLATAWSIITKHGGHIGVVSEPGKGTTFTLFLPASESPLPAETQSMAAECASPARPAKILVMDDEESVSRLVVRMLTPCGYSVVTVPNGQETLARYKQAMEAEAPFDAVILDLTIPGGPGGKEVIQDLLTLDPHVRAIVSSGYAEDPIMADPFTYGFKGTVAKPYTARALRETVAQVLT